MSELPNDLSGVETAPELRALFHRLNNELGVLLVQAELLESKSRDDALRARAAQIVSTTLAAMGTVREIRERTAPFAG